MTRALLSALGCIAALSSTACPGYPAMKEEHFRALIHEREQADTQAKKLKQAQAGGSKVGEGVKLYDNVEVEFNTMIEVLKTSITFGRTPSEYEKGLLADLKKIEGLNAKLKEFVDRQGVVSILAVDPATVTAIVAAIYPVLKKIWDDYQKELAEKRKEAVDHLDKKRLPKSADLGLKP